MKSIWVIHKLNSYIPSSPNSLLSPFRTQIHRSSLSPNSSTFILNHVDASLLLSICGRQGLVSLSSSIHASIIKNHEFHNPSNPSFHHALVIWNSLLSAYAKCGATDNAVKVFDEMPLRDTVSWNTMVSGFLRNGDVGIGFGLFKRMRELGFGWLDQASLTTVLSGCERPELCYASKMMHCLVVLSGFEREVTVGNALITAYFKCRCRGSGMQIFDEMIERNVISWTAVLSGLVQNEMYEESLMLFVEMLRGYVEPNFLTYLNPLIACAGLQALRGGLQIHGRVWRLGIQSDTWIESALMDMYSKCGSVQDSWRIFESASVLDEVSVTTMLVGLAQNEFEEEAIQIFVKARKLRIEIDADMLSAVLGVFGVGTSTGFGKQIHTLIIKKRFDSNSFVGNGLINMYSKCGDLEDSIKVFSKMPNKNCVSWNTMIAAFARHGDGLKALELYEDMRLNGVEPTDVTFISLLHACSHMGLVDKGMELLKFMTEFHRLSPRTEHYACVVDMLGRAGMLNEAKAFIEELPVKPDVLVWQALLGACGMHGNTEMGKYAAELLFLSEPDNAAPYILLANIYSSKGSWKERAMTIKRMKEKRVAKETGISWIEIERKVHSFVVADKMHPQAELIHAVLNELLGLMIDEGYVPDTRFILYYLDQDGKR